MWKCSPLNDTVQEGDDEVIALGKLAVYLAVRFFTAKQNPKYSTIYIR